MEPFETVEINNRIAKLIDVEQEEIRRVLLCLTAQIYEIVTELENTMECLGELDFLGAKARLSLELKATEPKLNKNGFTKLIAARHPLLGLCIHSNEKESSLEDIVPSRIRPSDYHSIEITTKVHIGGNDIFKGRFFLL
jgi:dsDNA-specific endonuclease/ATPase MutS2